VEVVSEGDTVNELMVVVEGELSSYRASSLHNAEARPLCRLGEGAWALPCGTDASL
jgi:CRP-like cAMP-binding protein